jgi:Tol biopolymer transport system component/predicted Ser/Thr protein kinase
MTIAAGTRLGPYEVVAPIGAGGMGEVWRGRDTRLDRSVAIKVISREFAERFEREAKSISALNHPHICTLYDVGENYLVMELLEGESLADKLAKGPLPLEQVLRYGVQIADALDKAHRAGIIHRDLKPGNIMITKSGAKLLDFGLAKSGGQPPSAVQDVTQHKPLTAEGTIVGTFQYMAPEQLEGEEADARTDIFAFGAVLYEMATGHRAFEGKTKTSLIAAIVGGEPKPMSQIEPLTPPSFENIVRKCLSKNSDDRWQCAADLRWELLRIQQEPETKRLTRTSRFAWGIAAAVVIAAAIVGAIALRPRVPSPPVRFSIAPPPGWTFAANYIIGPPAVSPDGRYVVFSAIDDSTGRPVLWLRDLRATEPALLAGTDGAGFPFWSPDSASIGFFAGGYLKRIDVNGGTPQLLCRVPFGRGGTWSEESGIVYTSVVNGPLFRVSPNGGTPQQLTRLDPSRRETSQRWPSFLPDGKHFLFLSRSQWTPDQIGDGIYVASVDSPKPRLLITASTNVYYSDPGYLVYIRDRTLVAQRFNTRTLQLQGEPRPLTREMMAYHPAGFGLFSCSRNGVLVFGVGSIKSRLEWLDRQGHVEPAIAASGDYATPRLTADQHHILYSYPDSVTGNLDIWLYDIDRSVSRRVTFHPRDELDGVLKPDGSQLIFSSNRSGFPDLYIKPINAPDEKLLLSSGQPIFGESVSPDGKVLLFRQVNPTTQNDVMALPLQGGKATPFIASPFNEIQPIFSPTGRWVAYTSNESGRYEVYACRYPDCGSRVQISTDGGTQPQWRGDEREFFYLAPGGWIMSVPINGSSPALNPGTPVRIAQVFLRPPRDEEREYEVTRDGRRFLINHAPQEKRSLPITVVVNWQTELLRK